MTLPSGYAGATTIQAQAPRLPSSVIAIATITAKRGSLATLKTF